MINLFKKVSAHGLSANRFAVAIRWNDRLMIHPEHLNASGERMISGPWILLAPDVSDSDLGHELLMCLRSSRKGTQETVDSAKMHADRCRLAGVRSERELSVGALFVNIFTTAEQIVLVPTRSGASGRDMDIKPLEDRRIELELDSHDEIVGRRLKRAWQSCSLI